LTVFSNPMAGCRACWFNRGCSPLADESAGDCDCVSLVVGLLMVVLFGYTSDQKAIGIAKDQLKAHLLAVRLYRDQIPVVMGSYGKILRGTGRYLKLAFKPLLYVIIPITLLMVQVDRYLGQTPIPVNAPFLLTVHTAAGEALNE
jgi:hypothetical protein